MRLFGLVALFLSIVAAWLGLTLSLDLDGRGEWTGWLVTCGATFVLGFEGTRRIRAQR